MFQRRRLKEAAYQNQVLSRQYERLQQAYTDNAMLFHDMDHHLQTIYQLACEGKADAVAAYTKRISAPVRELSHLLWSGVGIVDAILNAKQELAQEKGFLLDIDAELPANTGIEPEDYASVLSNLLDNAIEAMERQKKENPDEPRLKEPIGVRLRRINHFLLIQVTNPCAEDPSQRNGLFFTKKSGRGLHGYGLKSVKQAVAKYNGTFSCENADGYFTATAMLFFPER